MLTLKFDYDVRFIFVYGSLMEGFSSSEKVLKGKVEKRIKATINGRLYHLIEKGYPALVNGEDVVYGELLIMKDLESILPELDEIKYYYRDGNENNEYNRVKMEARSIDGYRVVAYVYKYNCNDIEKCKERTEYISSGDWKAYMENKINGGKPS